MKWRWTGAALEAKVRVALQWAVIHTAWSPVCAPTHQ